MPANHGSIFRFGLADAKFVRHASGSSVAPTSLASQPRCLTYRTVAYRRLGAIADCKSQAEKPFNLSTRLRMVEYIAMAKASLAWTAWREKDDAQAEKLATEALELWHGMDDPYSFDWMALWPLIAIAFARQDIARAIDL